MKPASDHVRDRRAERIARLLDRSRHRLKVDPRRALTLATTAERIATVLDDSRLLAQSLRAKANALWISGQPRAAVDLHQRALGVFEERGDTPEIARTLNASIQPLILVGRYADALGAAERARAIFAAQGDRQRLAWLDINVGNLYQRQDRLDEALASYRRAYQGLVTLQDADGLVSTLHNQAVTLIALGEFDQAVAAYREARERAAARGLSQAVAQADYNIARLFFLRGQYSRAMDMLRTADDASRRAGDAYHAALCKLDRSEIYLELNLRDDARDLGAQAHRQFEQLGTGFEAARALTNVAIAYGQDGRSDLALELFAKAKETFVSEEHRVWPSLIDLYQAVVLFNDGRLEDARRLATAALEFFSGAMVPTKAALCHLLLAEIALRLQDPPTARVECDAALGRLAGLRTPALHYQVRLLLGRIHLAAGDRRLAHETWESARQHLDTLRVGLRSDELKIAFLKNKGEVYERLVELCVEPGASQATLERALFYVEEAKSRSLLDLMVHPVLLEDPEDLADSELGRSIRALGEELNWYYGLIEREQLQDGARAPDRIGRLQREASAREQRLTSLLRELPIRGVDTELHAPTTVTLEALRAALPADGVLLEYFVVGDRLVLWLVSHQDVKVVPLSPMADVRRHLRRLQFQLQKMLLGGEYIETFHASLADAARSHLEALHAALLGPIWPLVRGRHLLVVAHGDLHHVPFHALFDGDQYVIDDCTVSYAPSASVYTLCDQQPRSMARTALVLGAGDARAPFTQVEAHTVATILPDSALYVGASATTAVLKERGRSSRTIHIASHGYFRPDNPMFSGIRLGDTFLNVYDLYRLQLPADLVTLSGCTTGLHLAAAGDELVGISRGLFCAGARSLLLTLWEVQDETTTRFMERFYERHVGGARLADAVRAAMLELRATHPHPYYWAPYALMGKVRPS